MRSYDSSFENPVEQKKKKITLMIVSGQNDVKRIRTVVKGKWWVGAHNSTRSRHASMITNSDFLTEYVHCKEPCWRSTWKKGKGEILGKERNKIQAGIENVNLVLLCLRLNLPS